MLIQSSIYSGAKRSQKVAVVLSGCGAMDGAEITEATALLISLSQKGFDVDVFAPDREQAHVINHKSGEPSEEKRNILVEAARIARGNIHALPELKPDFYYALAFAGGFGVAKNLCDFAFKGPEAQADKEILEVIAGFHAATKPVGALCIAPILLAIYCKEYGIKHAKITLGGKNDAGDIAREWGIDVIETKAGQAVLDKDNCFVSAPAYMYDDANPGEIMASADALTAGLIQLGQ